MMKAQCSAFVTSSSGRLARVRVRGLRGDATLSCRLVAAGFAAATIRCDTGAVRVSLTAGRDEAYWIERLSAQVTADLAHLVDQSDVATLTAKAASADIADTRHSMPIGRLMTEPGVAQPFDPDRGLTSADARARLARDGTNEIHDVTGRSASDLLIAQIKSVPVALLKGSAALALATRAYADAGAIAAVLAANATLGFITERQAEPTVSTTHPWHGSSTEIALLEFAAARAADVDALRRSLPTLEIRHRSEHHPYTVTLHTSDAAGLLVAVKGRPDEVLSRCDTWFDGERAWPLKPAQRRGLLKLNDAMAVRGDRVLALAFREQGGRRFGDTAGLSWLGLVGLADPLRADLPQMVQRFKAAGIRPLMITGDQLGTARAVDERIGLGAPQAMVDAARLSESADTAGRLGDLAEQASGFARTSPAMKLKIVRALQQRGHVVAMTGDGINDGPALRVADVGVAMGVTGTDFAQAMSDLLLRDDHPSAMLVAVEQGRMAFLNIKKSTDAGMMTLASLVSFGYGLARYGAGPQARTLAFMSLTSSQLLYALAMRSSRPLRAGCNRIRCCSARWAGRLGPVTRATPALLSMALPILPRASRSGAALAVVGMRVASQPARLSADAPALLLDAASLAALAINGQPLVVSTSVLLRLLSERLSARRPSMAASARRSRCAHRCRTGAGAGHALADGSSLCADGGIPIDLVAQGSRHGGPLR